MKNSEMNSLPVAQDLLSEAIQVLIEHLGITKTAFFIRQNLSSQTDYLLLKQELLGSKKAENIFGDIQKRKTSKPD